MVGITWFIPILIRSAQALSIAITTDNSCRPVRYNLPVSSKGLWRNIRLWRAHWRVHMELWTVAQAAIRCIIVRRMTILLCAIVCVRTAQLQNRPFALFRNAKCGDTETDNYNLN